MLKSPTFWTTEKDAPLLILNKGYLQSQGDAIFERVSTWPALAGAPSLENVTILEPENADRILIADSERTFRSEQDRAIFVRLLNHFHKKFGDYHQGLSYVASFLSLSLPEHDVVSLITHLNYTEKYLPGYWKHEAVQFGKDAYGFQELALKHVPKVAQHLQKNFVDPTSYLQKWFIGLFVHVLPFEFLFQFFEGFLEGGFRYSFQFGLSLLNQLSDKLLAINNDYSKFTGVLRLEAKFIPHDEQFNELLKRAFAGAKDYNLDDVNFNELRDQMYENHLRARMEAAKKSFDEKDEDEIEDCQICKDDFPEVYCKECNLKICENCHNKPPADSKHQRSHKVKEIEEDEEEEEEEEESDKEDEDEKSDAAVDKAAADLEKLTVNA